MEVYQTKEIEKDRWKENTKCNVTLKNKYADRKGRKCTYKYIVGIGKHKQNMAPMKGTYTKQVNGRNRENKRKRGK